MLFARTFPAYHPKRGQPTHFVEKIWKSLYLNGECPEDLNQFIQHYEAQVRGEYAKYNDIHKKVHTIREGIRWKVGDYFKPLVWSMIPYRSKTIQFAPPIMVEKKWKIKLDECGVISINGFYDYSEIVAADNFMEVLARNDGLSEEDLHFWFPLGKAFEGQIICWNKNIEY